ncbi:MAG: hypothetical protein IKD71_02210 [Solobacterium sp.]|nr:hypothetical protein [Solobacterium sp.]
MKKLLCAVCACILIGCSTDPAPDEPQGCDTDCEVIIGEDSDMSGYTELGEDHVFVDTSVQEMLRDMENGQTFVVYFGFVNCPWCQEAVPVLNEAAKDAGYRVGYINTRPTEDIHSNIEIPDYDLLTEAVGEFFPLDDEGIPHLYTPFVFFIRDGKVQEVHQGTVEGHDAHERRMTAEEKEELGRIYDQCFETLKQ